MKKKINWGDKEYRWVPGYEGIYEVNELGQVRSYRKRGNRGHKIVETPQTFLSHWVNRKKKKKIAQVTLFDGDTHRHYYVSRLVAQCFMGYDVNDTSKQIIYKDGNGMNPKISNLKIATVSERALNGIRLRKATDTPILEHIDTEQCNSQKHNSQTTDTMKHMIMKAKKILGLIN